MQIEGINADKLYSQHDLAPILHRSLAWFERSRWAGTGPRFLKIGRRVSYSGADVLAWLEAQSRTSTSDLGRKGG